MFTGIIEEVGKIISITNSDLTISCSTILEDVKIGDSIAVNGVCLTVAELKDSQFRANISKETLNVTALSELRPNNVVNLERALRLDSRLGGHIVTGHIDTVGKIKSVIKENEFYTLKIEVTKLADNYLVKKGSIAINGISLTIADVENNIVTIAIIPHTYKNTVLNELRIGDNVNIEFDILAKYVEKNLSTKNNSNITVDFLQRNGFV